MLRKRAREKDILIDEHRFNNRNEKRKGNQDLKKNGPYFCVYLLTETLAVGAGTVFVFPMAMRVPPNTAITGTGIGIVVVVLAAFVLHVMID